MVNFRLIFGLELEWVTRSLQLLLVLGLIGGGEPLRALCTDALVDSQNEEVNPNEDPLTNEGDLDDRPNNHPLIRLQTASPLEVVFDRQSVPERYYSFDPPRGLWVDATLHPFRNPSETMVLPLPHSETYSLKIDNFARPSQWVFNTSVMFDSRKEYPVPMRPNTFYHRTGRCGEGTDHEADNRIWPIGFSRHGNQYYALGHHEWYAKCDKQTQGNTNERFNRGWVNSIIFMESKDSGRTFLPLPYKVGDDEQGFRHRFVLKPEPYEPDRKQTLYGFFHPSNLVKEGDHLYAMVDYRGHSGVEESMTGGLVLIRTNDVANHKSWQIYSQSGWLNVADYEYLGNDVEPFHVFFKQTNWNPYTQVPKSVHMGARLLYHVPSQRFVAVGHGHDGQGQGGVSFIQSNSLANPDFEEHGVRFVPGTHGGEYVMYGGHYISAFNPNAMDANYIEFSDSLTLIVTDSHRKVQAQKLEVQWDQ